MRKSPISVAKQHGDCSVVCVCHGEVQLTVAIEIACSNAEWTATGRLGPVERKCSIAITQIDAHGVDGLIGYRQIWNTVTVEISHCDAGSIRRRKRLSYDEGAIAVAQQHLDRWRGIRQGFHFKNKILFAIPVQVSH